jgi:zinc protease
MALLRSLAIALVLVLPAPARPADLPTLGEVDTFRLENGLTVILAPVPTDRGLVAVRLHVAVGSSADPKDAVGLAHLVEHLVAQLPWDSKGDVLAYACGRSARVACNATTSADSTDYYLTVPRDHLRLALWAGAQFLGARPEDFPFARVRRERDVVKNEGRQKLEGVPYQRARLRLTELLGLSIQSYASEGEIGQSLAAVGPERVADFYQRHYNPGAATLVITGDFRTAAAEKLLDLTLAEVPASVPAPRLAVPAATPIRAQQATIEEEREVAPSLFLAWPTPAFHTPGDAAADLVSLVLTGPGGRLRSRLTHPGGPAHHVWTSQTSRPDTSVFFLQAVAQPGHQLSEIDQAIEGVLNELAEKGVTDDELEGARAIMFTHFARTLETPSDRAVALLQWYGAGGGDVRTGMNRDWRRYLELRTENLKQFVRQYLVPARRFAVEASPRTRP